MQRGGFHDAGQILVTMINDPEFVSQKGTTKRELWNSLCDLVGKHANVLQDLNVDRLMRSGMKKFGSELGKLWCSLADYYISLGHFHQARNVFEEGMNTVITVKDFTQIWDAYAKFEDTIIAAQMEAMEKKNIMVQYRQHFGGKWCRVSMGTVEEMKVFCKALKQICG